MVLQLVSEKSALDSSLKHFSQRELIFPLGDKITCYLVTKSDIIVLILTGMPNKGRGWI